MADTRQPQERQAWLEGAVEHMEKRIALMEKLYESIDRKLWLIIALGFGSIISIFLKN